MYNNYYFPMNSSFENCSILQSDPLKFSNNINYELYKNKKQNNYLYSLTSEQIYPLPTPPPKQMPSTTLPSQQPKSIKTNAHTFHSLNNYENSLSKQKYIHKNSKNQKRNVYKENYDNSFSLNKRINLSTSNENNLEYNKRSLCFLTSSSKSNKDSSSLNYCNNCGKNGHGFYQCKNPITSYGVIVFRYKINPLTKHKERQYLMIQRRDTISYVDFLRGKYSLFNRKYIKNLIKDMTETEQEKITSLPFDYLWYELWKDNAPNPNDKIRNSFELMNETNKKPLYNIKTDEYAQKSKTASFLNDEEKDDINNIKNVDVDSLLYCSEQSTDTLDNIKTKIISQQFNENDNYNTKEKFNILQKGIYINDKPHFTIAEIVEELKKERKTSNIEAWKEPEWGFCKGRRNYKESDFDCAVREMQEETGYSKENMYVLKNINTFEEIFIGSNFKCYKHKYYLMYMTYEESLKTAEFEKSEVACIKWASFNECISLIRSYNIEKKRMISNIENSLDKYAIFM
jgi:8-oxo-dGTP pyrophosphatase MutT (NUDIX family)